MKSTITFQNYFISLLPLIEWRDSFHVKISPITAINNTILVSKTLRLRLHVPKMKSHPGVKLVLGWKKFCLHVSFILDWNEKTFIPGWNFIWKKTSHWVWWKHNKISHFSQLLKSEAWYVKNMRRLKARCIKWLRLNAWGLQFYLKRDSGTGVFLWILSIF